MADEVLLIYRKVSYLSTDFYIAKFGNVFGFVCLFVFVFFP